jgi:hypothetical protein
MERTVDVWWREDGEKWFSEWLSRRGKPPEVTDCAERFWVWAVKAGHIKA